MTKRVCTSIWIESTAETVWSALTEFENYRKWNPFIREVKGKLRISEELSFKVARGGGDETQVTATLLRIEPGRELAWGGGSRLGLFRGEHSFIITPGDGGITLNNCEVFSGPLSYILINKQRLHAQRKAFEMQDSALKRWLENGSAEE